MASRRPLPKPRQELAPVGSALRFDEFALRDIDRVSLRDLACIGCGHHKCSCHAKPAWVGPVTPAPEPGLLAVLEAEQRMLRLRRLASAAAEEAAMRERERVAADLLARSVAARKAAADREDFFRDLQPLVGKQLTYGGQFEAWNSTAKQPDAAPAAGAFPKTAEEFAMFVADPRPLLTDV